MVILLFIGETLFGQFIQINHGARDINRDNIERQKCISEQERFYVREYRFDVEHDSMRDTVLFNDPMSSGGMMNYNDSAHHHIWNYVDQNSATGWVLVSGIF